MKPALNEAKLDARLLREIQANGKKQFHTYLKELLPSKMIEVCSDLVGIPRDTQANQMTAEQRRRLRLWLKDFRLEIVGHRSGLSSIVTAGGVSLAEINPRMAVAYHFFNDFDTAPDVLQDIRRTYDGPLALAVDYMVFNITKDDTLVRMSAIDEAIWPPAAQKEKLPPDVGKMVPMSDFVRSGEQRMPDVVGPIYDEINKLYGTDIQVPGQ